MSREQPPSCCQLLSNLQHDQGEEVPPALVRNSLKFRRSKEELKSLGHIVNAYLDLVEDRTSRKIPMTMEDWVKRLDLFLEFSERDILQDKGKVTVEKAKAHAESEFDKVLKQIEATASQGDDGQNQS